MPGWTADRIPDLSGRTAVVTGANTGLGRQVSIALARRGARVVLACRDVGKGSVARDALLAVAPAADAAVARLDLADLGSVREFAASYDGPVHLLVNNAGVMAIPPRVTADGFEMQFGTNHLGHFALTGLLLPALLAAPGARVVTMSSVAHRTGRLDLDNLAGERGYRRWAAYGQSKLANLLFAAELARRAAGAGLVSVAAHPGYAATDLQRRGPQLSGSRLGGLLAAVGNRLLGQSAATGALPVLYAATAPDVVTGEYFGPAGPMEMRGRPTRVGRSAAAADPALAARLWAVSETLTGVRYAALEADPLAPDR